MESHLRSVHLKGFRAFSIHPFLPIHQQGGARCHVGNEGKGYRSGAIKRDLLSYAPDLANLFGINEGMVLNKDKT